MISLIAKSQQVLTVESIYKGLGMTDKEIAEILPYVDSTQYSYLPLNTVRTSNNTCLSTNSAKILHIPSLNGSQTIYITNENGWVPMNTPTQNVYIQKDYGGFNSW